MIGSRPLKPEEIDLISCKLGPRDRCLFILGICTGFRISELLSLKVTSVEMSGRIADQVTVERRNMKGKTESRTVPLNQKAKKVISEWLAYSRAKCRYANCAGKDLPLFPSIRSGRAINRRQAWRLLTGAFRSIGLSDKLGTHCMRKTFAAKMYERLNHDLIKTQKAMGHKSISSTTSYLSFAESEVNDAILKDWD